MKIKLLKSIIASAVTITGMATSLTIQAASFSGTLGTASYSVDAWTFICPTGTTKVLFRVTDGRNPINSLATVYASFAPVARSGLPVLTAADKDIDTLPSPWVTNTTSGAGSYVVIIRKTAANMEDFITEVQCQNSLGTVLGPSSFSKIHDQ